MGNLIHQVLENNLFSNQSWKANSLIIVHDKEKLRHVLHPSFWDFYKNSRGDMDDDYSMGMSVCLDIGSIQILQSSFFSLSLFFIVVQV